MAFRVGAGRKTYAGEDGLRRCVRTTLGRCVRIAELERDLMATR